MIYPIQRANLITVRLKRFTKSDAFRVARQFVNLDFWIEEVVRSIDIIDEHNARFDKMIIK